MSLGFSIKGVGGEQWSAVAMNPAGHLRSMAKSLPFCGDPDEVRDRLADKFRLDNAFAREYEEWIFYPLRIDKAIRVRQVVPSG